MDRIEKDRQMLLVHPDPGALIWTPNQIEIINQSLGPIRPYHTHNGTNFNCHSVFCGFDIDDNAPDCVRPPSRKERPESDRPHPLQVARTRAIGLKKKERQEKEKEMRIKKEKEKEEVKKMEMLRKDMEEADEARDRRQREWEAKEVKKKAARLEDKVNEQAFQKTLATSAPFSPTEAKAGNTSASNTPVVVGKKSTPATSTPLVPPKNPARETSIPPELPKSSQQVRKGVYKEVGGELAKVDKSREKDLAHTRSVNTLMQKDNIRSVATGVPKDDEVEERLIGGDETLKLAMAGGKSKEAKKGEILKDEPKKLKRKIMKAATKGGRRR